MFCPLVSVASLDFKSVDPVGFLVVSTLAGQWVAENRDGLGEMAERG